MLSLPFCDSAVIMLVVIIISWKKYNVYWDYQ